MTDKEKARIEEAALLHRFTNAKTPWWVARVEWDSGVSHVSIVGNAILPVHLCRWIEQGATVTILATVLPMEENK